MRGDKDLEELNKKLNDDTFLEEYRRRYDNYKVSAIPRLLGSALVVFGDILYGRKPSYLKFRAIEVIARVPYHSWDSAAYTLLTVFYRNEKKAMKLGMSARFSRLAQDNETMHVVVISNLAVGRGRAGLVRHTILPMFFAFFYFWWSYVLYLVNPRYSFELNYVFENHAFEQYGLFLEMYGDELKQRGIYSDFLKWYGRTPANQYEFFLSIRNDEIIHRNSSIEEIIGIQ